MPSAEFDAEYSAITGDVAWIDLSDRTQIEFTGADRAKFLHNLCTNVVRDLPAGRGCEAFVLNVKGHILAHAFLFVCPDSIVLETVPHQAETLCAFFERYLIREDVQIIDRSQQWGELYLAGQRAEKWLTQHGCSPPQSRLDHAAAHLDGVPLWVRKVDLTGPVGFLLAAPQEQISEVQKNLAAAGVKQCGNEAFETARIEYGMPWFGSDISDENLPQEIGRDQDAISFTKGCYLGQETVARIDALGHVNRLQTGVKFSDQSIPQVGLELKSGGKPVGQVMSACWSPKLQAPLAIALLRRGHHEPGTELESSAGSAKVVVLPVTR